MVLSLPYFSRTTQFVSSLPMKVLMPLQFVLLAVCPYILIFPRNSNWKSNQRKEGSVLSHTFFSTRSTCLCLLSCSDRFKHIIFSHCSSMSTSFRTSQLTISRKEKKPGAPTFVFGDHKNAGCWARWNTVLIWWSLKSLTRLWFHKDNF